MQNRFHDETVVQISGHLGYFQTFKCNLKQQFRPLYIKHKKRAIFTNLVIINAQFHSKLKAILQLCAYHLKEGNIFFQNIAELQTYSWILGDFALNF